MKRVSLICLAVIVALMLFGCGENKQGEEITPEKIVMIYNSLNSRYMELLDFHQALGKKKVSKFDWRFIADSSKKSSQRIVKSLESSKHPLAPQLMTLGKDVIALTNELEQEVDHGKKPDLSYQKKVEAELKELEPEIEKIKAEVMEKQ